MPNNFSSDAITYTPGSSESSSSFNKRVVDLDVSKVESIKLLCNTITTDATDGICFVGADNNVLRRTLFQDPIGKSTTQPIILLLGYLSLTRTSSPSFWDTKVLVHAISVCFSWRSRHHSNLYSRTMVSILSLLQEQLKI